MSQQKNIGIPKLRLSSVQYKKDCMCSKHPRSMRNQTLKRQADTRSQGKCRNITISSKEEVMAALTILLALMLARTDAPNPIDES